MTGNKRRFLRLLLAGAILGGGAAYAQQGAGTPTAPATAPANAAPCKPQTQKHAMGWFDPSRGPLGRACAKFGVCGTAQPIAAPDSAKPCPAPTPSTTPSAAP